MKYIGLLLCLLIGIQVDAQKNGWQKSELRKSQSTRFTHALVDFDSSNYYVLRFDKNRYKAEIEQYNDRLQHVQTVETTDKRRRYAGVMHLDTSMYIFYFNYKKNKATDSYKNVGFYAKKIENQTYKTATDSITIIAPFNMESSAFKGDLVLSPDRSKFLVFSYEEEGDEEQISGLSNTIMLRVFDKNFTPIWERKVNLSPDGKLKRKVAIKKLRINNKGQVLILTDIFTGARSYEGKKVNTAPTLFFVEPSPKAISRFTPDLGNLFFKELDVSYDQEGNIIWFGFYSKKRYYMQSGIFFIKIKADLSRVLTKKKHDFTPNLIAKMMNRRKISEKREALHFKFVQYHLTSDSGLIVTTEQQPQGGLFYKSNNILALRFNSSGELRWKKVIKKYSVEQYKLKPFLSHHSFLVSDSLHVIFNNGVLETNAALIHVITPNGSVRKKTILSYDNHFGLLCPRLSYLLPNGQLFCSFQDRYFSEYRFGVLNLPKVFD
jgi:hypothetical protein